MQISSTSHLSFCTNIYSGESWEDLRKSLPRIRAVREQLGHAGPFGLGLRLSAQAAQEMAGPQVGTFREWLADNDCYVFTLNGFPYGAFHDTVVKDQVHRPDWTTRERVTYTIQLFDLLSQLLPTGVDGGISTSPLSYRPWFTTAEAVRRATEQCVRHLMEVVLHLARIKARTGQSLHLDLEPEPDGLIETSQEFVDFFENEVLTTGLDWLQRQLGTTPTLAEATIREHLCLCWDVCHFAVGFESPAEVLRRLRAAGINVGKLQLSAALGLQLSADRAADRALLQPYDEPTYLHQAVLRSAEGLTRFPDLAPALAALDDARYTELRTHFHVPIYANRYGRLLSTNDDIAATLLRWKDDPFTQHLEVETYTWDVLPDHQRLGLDESIARELKWVLAQLR